MIIEQFLPAFHYGDAIGNSTLRFHEYLLSQGINSRIIALSIHATGGTFDINAGSYVH